MKQNETGQKGMTYTDQLRGIATLNGMREYDLFVKFMVKRFPHEKSYSYMMNKNG